MAIDDENVAPLLIQEAGRAERRGGFPPNPKRQAAISPTPAPGATPPQLRRGAIFAFISNGPCRGSALLCNSTFHFVGVECLEGPDIFLLWLVAEGTCNRSPGVGNYGQRMGKQISRIANGKLADEPGGTCEEAFVTRSGRSEAQAGYVAAGPCSHATATSDESAPAP